MSELIKLSHCLSANYLLKYYPDSNIEVVVKLADEACLPTLEAQEIAEGRNSCKQKNGELCRKWSK